MDLLSMTWRDGLFAHWPVEPDVVESNLPPGVEVATYDGDAWLGVVAFLMEDIRPRGFPFGRSFPEVNLRTYVRHGDDRGVYFFSLDASDRLSVGIARTLFSLPYYYARAETNREGEWRHLESERDHSGEPATRLDVSYRPTGERFFPEPTSLEAFLTENYRFFTRGRRLYQGTISHEPWTLRTAEATFRANTLFEAVGFEQPAGEPLCHVGDPLAVTADRLRTVDSRRVN